MRRIGANPHPSIRPSLRFGLLRMLIGEPEQLGDTSELRKAAQAYNLPDDWINDGPKGFASILPADFQQRLSRLNFPFQHLRLYALGRPEQVVMKIVALREQDLEDLEFRTYAKIPYWLVRSEHP